MQGRRKNRGRESGTFALSVAVTFVVFVAFAAHTHADDALDSDVKYSGRVDVMDVKNGWEWHNPEDGIMYSDSVSISYTVCDDGEQWESFEVKSLLYGYRAHLRAELEDCDDVTSLVGSIKVPYRLGWSAAGISYGHIWKVQPVTVGNAGVPIICANGGNSWSGHYGQSTNQYCWDDNLPRVRL